MVAPWGCSDSWPWLVWVSVHGGSGCLIPVPISPAATPGKGAQCELFLMQHGFMLWFLTEISAIKPFISLLKNLGMDPERQRALTSMPFALVRIVLLFEQLLLIFTQIMASKSPMLSTHFCVS